MSLSFRQFFKLIIWQLSHAFLHQKTAPVGQGSAAGDVVVEPDQEVLALSQRAKENLFDPRHFVCWINDFFQRTKNPPTAEETGVPMRSPSAPPLHCPEIPLDWPTCIEDQLDLVSFILLAIQIFTRRVPKWIKRIYHLHGLRWFLHQSHEWIKLYHSQFPLMAHPRKTATFGSQRDAATCVVGCRWCPTKRWSGYFASVMGRSNGYPTSIIQGVCI